MCEWLHKIFVYSSYHFFAYFRFASTSFYFMKFSCSFVVQSYIYVLKWYIIHCVIYFRFIECWQTWHLGKVNKKVKTEKESAIDAESSCLGFTSFNVSLVYSLKRPINYCCRFCNILCMIFKKRLFIEVRLKAIIPISKYSIINNAQITYQHLG